MSGFIIRPFGEKRGIDFERVDRELISPALERLNVTGRTTMDIARAGSIRADMFHLLLTADLVVADLSIHNANVFYELGVRHALRDRGTFLIRANIDEIPFDLKTDRYLEYDPAEPGRTLDELIKGLAATMRERVVDSPVYGLVPGLQPPDPSSFVVVPRDFQEEVKIASAAGQGGDLRFLASELDGLRWKREGRRVVGEAQFRLKDLAYAAETWESIREEQPDDVQANLRLGTINQKLGDLTRSDIALERVVGANNLAPLILAEACALRGSNAKTRWLADWKNDDAVSRRTAALQSPFLVEALHAYRQGFEAEPRHFYSGLNALALVAVLTELAALMPDVWNGRFADEDDARSELKKYTRLRSQLSGAVEFSLLAEKQRLERLGKKDNWLAISFADLAFLLVRPNIAQLYRDALAGLDQFALASVRRQLEIFPQLELLPDAVKACAQLFQLHVPEPERASLPRVILFTGHRVDAPNREKPRFPATQEATARAAIKSAVEAVVAAASEKEQIVAIAGAASGADLLFLEICEELGLSRPIVRRIFLIIPRDDYVRESVAPSGPGWVGRFNRQANDQSGKATTRYYQGGLDLPAWLQDKANYSVWERSNLWMLHNALWLGGTKTTLIALWDGESGDGPGGTKHMVESAAARGAETVVLDTKQLFSL